MHEVELARRVIELAHEAVSGRSPSAISTVHLRVGELAAVDPEALAFAFDALKAGTVAGAASLVFESVPVRWVCATCGAEWDSGVDRGVTRNLDPGGEPGCRQCGGSQMVMGSGAELEVTAVTLTGSAEDG